MLETIKYSVNHQQITYKNAVFYLTSYNILEFVDCVYGPDWFIETIDKYLIEGRYYKYETVAYFDLIHDSFSEKEFKELYNFIIENKVIGCTLNW